MSTSPEEPMKSGARRVATLRSSMASFAGSFALSVAAYFIVNAAAARLLGVEGFASFLFVYTVALVAGPVAIIGVHRSGLREVSRLTDLCSPQGAQLRDDIRVVATTTLPVVSVIVGAFAAGLNGGRFHLSLGLIAAALVYVNGIQTVIGNYLRGIGRPTLAAIYQGRSGGSLIGSVQAVLLGALLLTGASTSLEAVLTTVMLAYLPPLAVGLWLVWRSLPHRGEREPTLRRLTAIWHRDWRFLAASTAASISWFVEIWIAALTLSPLSASLFGAGHRLAQVLALPQSALQTIFSPAIARLWHHGSRKDTQDLVRTGSFLSTLAAALGLGVLAMAPTGIITLVFGRDFAAATTIMLIMAVGVAVNTATGLCGATLSMTGHEGQVAAIAIVALLARLGLGIPAALVGGVLWLAVTTASVTIGQNVALWAVARHTVGINTLPQLRPRLTLLTSTKA